MLISFGWQLYRWLAVRERALPPPVAQQEPPVQQAQQAQEVQQVMQQVQQEVQQPLAAREHEHE